MDSGSRKNLAPQQWEADLNLPTTLHLKSYQLGRVTEFGQPTLITWKFSINFAIGPVNDIVECGVTP